MNERELPEYHPHSVTPQRTQTRTGVIVDIIGGSAFGADAAERFSNGQIVAGSLATVASLCFFAKPAINEIIYRRKIKKFNQSNS